MFENAVLKELVGPNLEQLEAEEKFLAAICIVLDSSYSPYA
jgi:hypothetical protein